MKYVLYGMPCAGKTTLLEALETKLRVSHGRKWLDECTGGTFLSLSDNEKKKCRIKYTEYISEFENEDVISDGHYAFDDEVIFTEEDGNVYDVFFYLYCEPEILLERMKESSKNKRFSDLSLEHITKWQSRELEQLRWECHNRNKDFYVVKSLEITPENFLDFVTVIGSGFSSYRVAVEIVDQIKDDFKIPCELHLIDGDKTFINQDSFRKATHGFRTKVFDGDFYTGYQAYCFEKETSSLDFDFEELEHCSINEMIWSEIENKDYIVISAGITKLWKWFEKKWNIPHMFASPLISADGKFYITKLLRESGYKIISYGDSRNDLYMLKEADKSFLYIGEKLSRSLNDSDVSKIQLLYHKDPYIMDKDPCIMDKDICKAIELCKSSSGINGARLAQAHLDLGQQLGECIKKKIPNKNAALVILERGGRFFGDGVYLAFGGKLHPYNAKIESLPLIEDDIILIVDSVINTGESTLDLVSKFKQNNPLVHICIVTNVIQRDAISKFQDYGLFAVRVSDNKYVGKRQEKQVGNTGPDTADRLFNLI